LKSCHAFIPTSRIVILAWNRCSSHLDDQRCTLPSNCGSRFTWFVSRSRVDRIMVDIIKIISQKRIRDHQTRFHLLCTWDPI
jgi:hypothetical protein